ncbi:juvenile hormone acid O-methyltransferase [Linepithema humile]|uniref:juvenile hormone acid O-methyltransferase n=1 Tax=Linepithema humile TaxID=83485 RepID=UPI0006232FBC|nr:PREDICTED: sterol 24-C-methyltransferase-like [Linepithema humile]
MANSYKKLQRRNSSFIIEEFEDDFKGMSGKCMEIGCGYGDTTKDILLPALDPNAVIIGADTSEKMIEHANKTYGDNKRLKFVTFDIETKDLPEEYISEFDHIFSFPGLFVCKDIRQVFENIYRMLRPGGTMHMLLVASHTTFEVFKVMAEDKRYAPYVWDATPFRDADNPSKELKELLRSIGFTVHHCSHRQMSFSAKYSDAFPSAIMSNLSVLDKMPSNRKEDFMHEFVSEFMKGKLVFKNGDEEHMTNVYRSLIISAQK